MADNYDDNEEDEIDDEKDSKPDNTKCPNCGEDAYTQFICEFCGQSTCAFCDTPMKPCLGCGRLLCHDCTEETLSVSGEYRERICNKCAEEMDKTTFDSYWVHGKKRWKALG